MGQRGVDRINIRERTCGSGCSSSAGRDARRRTAVRRRWIAATTWARRSRPSRAAGCGELAEQLGYDSFWLTEPSFQHEGYEVVPNGLCSGISRGATTGSDRHDVQPSSGSGHPLRLAEDLPVLHNLSGGRGILGVGRGTVPVDMLRSPPAGVGGFVRQPVRGEPIAQP